MESMESNSTKATMESCGWQLKEYPKVNLNDSYMVYFRDFRADTLTVMALQKVAFSDFKVNLKLPISNLVEKLTPLLNKLHNGIGLTEGEVDEINPLLIHYIKKTQAYFNWKNTFGGRTRAHFIINIYKDNQAGGEYLILRPVLISSAEEIIIADDVTQMTDEIYYLDRERNKSWFR
ncbi:hypothetical protein [Yersinia enterocolitica]|uniref:hypothetical protein n=1 Tax=Yersinia enterocolitica TaxID=630 RepID=UPI003D01D4A5